MDVERRRWRLRFATIAPAAMGRLVASAGARSAETSVAGEPLLLGAAAGEPKVLAAASPCSTPLVFPVAASLIALRLCPLATSRLCCAAWGSYRHCSRRADTPARRGLRS